jgi:predicted transcriptional regulator
MPMEKMLTKAEEQVMQTLWKMGEGGLREITDAMPKPQPHSNTVATILKILSEKEFVQITTVGRINCYTPKISKKEYFNHSITKLGKTYFDGSYSRMVAALVENKKMSIDDLELLLHKLKRRKHV